MTESLEEAQSQAALANSCVTSIIENSLSSPRRSVISDEDNLRKASYQGSWIESFEVVKTLQKATITKLLECSNMLFSSTDDSVLDMSANNTLSFIFSPAQYKARMEREGSLSFDVS